MSIVRMDNVAIVVDDLDASKVELTRYDAPAPVTPDPPERVRPLGGQVLGEVAYYEDTFRLCYLRGPSGIIVALAKQIG